ncbi:MAG: hypothetical protein ABR881_30015 [Candidatus Sulfotelmatobacter sp.]
MKSKVVPLVVLWVLSLCPSVGNAQTSHHTALTVKVPFEFVVGNQTLPAGTYKFLSLLNSVPSKATIDVLEVRSTEGHLYKAVVTDVVGSEEPNNPRLVFTRSGDRAFLSEVWEPGKSAGCRLQNRKDILQTVERENDKVTLIASADSH